MAPFDGRYSPDLINKVSTQIDGQLPDFVVDDHPVFSSFLQSYYKYLESGELVVSATIDNVLLEVETTTRLLDEEDNRIVLEKGTGTTGKFEVGETITGSTSKGPLPKFLLMTWVILRNQDYSLRLNNSS